ncbi:Rossmann fold nucleotide-binding protein [Gaertneriomyces semiglobifer]|nr:Rossmann fold nucleotide-binding protein [Gaertneriomyces semiglobifer]
MQRYRPFPQKADTSLTKTATLDPRTAQTTSSSYRLAWADEPFLLRDDLRPLRLQLEYTKPEKIMIDHGIESTIVVFGSARFRDAAMVDEMTKKLEKRQKEVGDTEEVKKLKRQVEIVKRNVKYYQAAMEFGELVTKHSNGNKLVVITGGGPGIMEAANRGASNIPNGRSVGLNIVLPFEQHPNPYITPELCFNFHYFSMRKMHFLGRARALVAFPGGWGTMDELFEALTLIQTKKMAPIPVVLFCKSWWDKIVSFEAMVEEGVISEEDLNYVIFAETAQEAWQHIHTFYKDHVAESGTPVEQNVNTTAGATGGQAAQ